MHMVASFPQTNAFYITLQKKQEQEQETGKENTKGK